MASYTESILHESVGWLGSAGQFFDMVLLRVLHVAAISDMPKLTPRSGSVVLGVGWALLPSGPITIQQSSSGFLMGLRESKKEMKSIARSLKAWPWKVHNITPTACCWSKQPEFKAGKILVSLCPPLPSPCACLV